MEDLWQYHRAALFAERLDKMRFELASMTDLPAEETAVIAETLSECAGGLRKIAAPVVSPQAGAASD